MFAAVLIAVLRVSSVADGDGDYDAHRDQERRSDLRGSTRPTMASVAAGDEREETMDDQYIAALRALIADKEELHAVQIDALERKIAGLQEVIRDLADAALALLEINAPRERTDTVVIEHVIRRANNALEYLDPPRH